MKSQDIRNTFLNFFESKNHKVVPSAPMVIKDDPSLMFTNAGMNQFKEYFLGTGSPKNPRVTDTQKCLRVSGKHNDLEEVGRDTYHHTMFEMLGNWSFGDYFKKDAIGWAWELLTEVYGIEKDRLFATVFEGSPEEDIPMDQEALDLWKAILPENQIIFGNKKDNFWEMGDQGPCGPSSEIHVDIRPERERSEVSARDLVNKDHPQVVEIWNLVFIQFNRKADGSLEKLPQQHVDTGMGFERLCMVLQGKISNYDTDIFTPIIQEIESITEVSYGKNEDTDIAIRVVSDHIRAVAFAIADGQLPGNTGAGYVIRRILRRAIRYGFTFLGQKQAFIYKLVDRLVKQMATAFPELKSQQSLIENVIREEENSFLRTLEQGLGRLDEIIRQTQGKVVSGQKAFELYDTYGFPIDLTALILSDEGYDLDTAAFEMELQKQKDRAREATKMISGDWMEVHPTQEGEGFIGYDQLQAEVKILRYRQVENKKEGKRYQLVLNQTPFYPEGGGQVGDKGYLEGPAGEVVHIEDTRRENNQIIHLTRELPADVKLNFKAVVNVSARARTAANHSATHLLHQALRSILGTHVEQKGSMVGPEYLRFDFSHYSKLSSEELEQVESFVNDRIAEKIELEDHREVPFQEALDRGAIALFGEKYGETVRTVRFGKSMELCGGTHVANTGDIWHFKITAEGAVAAGVRRIEAITSEVAKRYFQEQATTLNTIGQLVKNPKDPQKAIEQLQQENSELKKQVESLLKDKARSAKNNLRNELEEKDGVRFLAKKVDLDAPGIKDVSFQLGSEVEDLFLLFAAEDNGKVLLSCYISKGLVEKKDLHAGKVVKELGKYIQGGGGGQPFYATAGGRNPQGIDQALEAARKLIFPEK